MLVARLECEEGPFRKTPKVAQKRGSREYAMIL